MKLKFLPDDFQVEEMPTVAPGGDGEESFYRLTKRALTTPEAFEQLARAWKRPAREFSFGGLKDRHAETVQYFTLHRGPEQGLARDGMRVEYLGRLAHPYQAQDFSGNRFRVTLRDLDEDLLRQVEARAAEVAAVGVANYFDDQRFGSVAPGQPFIAHAWITGRPEAALRQAILGEYAHDRGEVKRQKSAIAQHWGNWARCQALTRDRSTRQAFGHLRNRPQDFDGALQRLHPELQGLYLAAYQSHVWNRVLARWVQAHCTEAASLPLKLGEFPTPVDLPPEAMRIWESLELPLPSARVRPEQLEPWAGLYDAVLAEDGLTLEGMKLNLRKPFFSRGTRTARLVPAGWRSEPGDDECHPGRRRLTLHFELPRAAYATMLVKRLTSR